MNTINVAGVDVAILNKNLFKEIILKKLKEDKTKLTKVSTINTEFLHRAYNNKEFYETLKDCEINLCDGVGVMLAARFMTLKLTKIKILKNIQAIWQMVYSLFALLFFPKFCRYPIPENIRGHDNMLILMEAAAEANAPVYIFGSEQSVLEAAIKNIKSTYPNIIIAGSCNGYDYKSDEDVINAINNTNAVLLTVALGVPRQELWINKYQNKLTKIKVAASEGGAVNYIAGEFKRPHPFMQKRGLEWLHRLITQKSKSASGSRIKRYWNAVPVLISELVKYKLANGHTILNKDK